MISLTAAPNCTPDDWLCRKTYDVTGSSWLAEAANWVIAKPASALLIIALGLVARWVARRLIKRLVQRLATGVVPIGHARDDEEALGATSRIAFARRRQRAETTGGVLSSIASFLIFGVVVIMVLAEFGVAVAPLIAGAGIVGVALGFGAQSLVSDFLAGLFMVFEDQYGIGDVVDLGDASGSVEAVSLRVTRLRDVNGTVWYVRNGEIMRVGNQSQNWARMVLDVSVAYGEDLTRIRRVLGEVCQDLWESDPHRERYLEEPEVWGVERIDPDGIIVRVAIKTAPNEQWAIARDLREKVKARFDAEGIEMPYPQRVVWNRRLVDDRATDTDSGE